MASNKIIDKLLKPQCVVLRLKAESKNEAINELLTVLDAAGAIDDTEQARADVFERERKMSTGLKDGLALPHAKTTGVSQLCMALGLKPEGIEFDSLDNRPASMIFLVFSCADKTGPHLQCLAEITGACREPAVRKALLKATRTREVIAALTG